MFSFVSVPSFSNLLTFCISFWRIRVRERLTHDRPSHQSAELSTPSEYPVYRSHAKISTTNQEEPKSHFHYHPSQLNHSRTGQAENQDPGCRGYLSIGTEPSCPQVQQDTQIRVEETNSPSMAEGLLKKRKAVLIPEISQRERRVNDIHPGRSYDTDMAALLPSQEEVLVGEPRGRQGRWSQREEYTEHVSRLQATEEMYARARQAQERAPNGWYNQHGTTYPPSGIQGSSPATSGRWAPDPTKQMSRYPSASGRPQTTLETTSQKAIRNREAVPQEVRATRDQSPVDVRVSVAQLRHSYLESATNSQKSEQYVVLWIYCSVYFWD